MREKENERLQRIPYQKTEAAKEPSSQQPPEKGLFSQGSEEEFVQKSDQDREEAEAEASIVIQGDSLLRVPVEVWEHKQPDKE